VQGIPIQEVDEIETVQCHASRLILYIMITQDTYSTVSSVVDNLGWKILEQHRHLHQLQKFCKATYGTAGIKFPPEVQPLS